MDVWEQCVVRDGGTQRLVWSVLDWDCQQMCTVSELFNTYIDLIFEAITLSDQLHWLTSLEQAQFSQYTI